MALGQEDLGVLMRILAENIGEGSKAASVEGTKASTKGIRRFIVPPSMQHDSRSIFQSSCQPLFAFTDEAVSDEGLIDALSVTGSQTAITNGTFSENVVNVLLNFEIKEVI